MTQGMKALRCNNTFSEKSTFVEMWEIHSKSTNNLIFPLNYMQQKLIMMELAMSHEDLISYSLYHFFTRNN